MKLTDKNKIIFPMMHGMMSEGGMWNGFKLELERYGHICETSTLPGHHPRHYSNSDPSGLGLQDYVNFFWNKINEISSEYPDCKIIPLGHSMGSQIVKQCAAHPKIDGVVMLAPPSSNEKFIPCWSTTKCFKDVLLKPWKKTFKFDRSTFDYAVGNRLSDAEQQRVFKNLVPESSRVVWELGPWWLDPTRAAWVDHSKIKCPVYILVGSEDNITPPAMAKAIKKKIPHAKLEIFLGHAHWLLDEDGWEEIVNKIDFWVRDEMH